MPITKLMEGLPSRTMPQTDFDAASEKYMSELPQWGDEANALEANVNAKELSAGVSASIALAQANAAQAAVNAAVWVSGTTYAIGDRRYSPTNQQTYSRLTAGAGTTDPVVDSTNWRAVTIASVAVQIKSAPYTATISDKSNMLVYTGTSTLSLDPIASLGNGWFMYVVNRGTGNITIDPNGTEQINAATTYLLPPNSGVMLSCDSAGFYVLGEKKLGRMIVQERQVSGVGGQTMSLGSNERTLNTTVENTIPGATLTGTRVSLPPGTYRVHARAPAAVTATQQLVWTNSTGGGGSIVGSTVRGVSTVDTSSEVNGTSVITSTGSFFLDHWVSAVGAANSGGSPAATPAGINIFSQVEIYQLA